MNLLNKIVNMILPARVRKVSDDTEQFPSVQISYLGKVVDATRLNPYPIVSNPPSDALAYKINIGAMEENRAAILHDPKKRKKLLKAGEGGIHNSLTDSFVVLIEDGSIDVFAKQDILENITKDRVVTVGGDVFTTIAGGKTETVAGDTSHTTVNYALIASATINQTATTSITLTAPTVNVAGILAVTSFFGCNGNTPQPKATLGNAATDLATCIALANNMRSALIANGIGQP